MILEIVTPEATLYSGKVKSITLPGVDGAFQILNNHAPIVSLLNKGTIIIEGTNHEIKKESSKRLIKNKDGKITLTINGGTLEMNDNKVIILFKSVT